VVFKEDVATILDFIRLAINFGKAAVPAVKSIGEDPSVVLRVGFADSDAHHPQYYLIPNCKAMREKTTYSAEFLHMFAVSNEGAASSSAAGVGKGASSSASGVGTGASSPAPGDGTHIILQLEPGATMNGVVWPKVSTEVSIARDLSAKPPFTLHLLRTRVVAMNQRLILGEEKLCHEDLKAKEQKAIDLANLTKLAARLAKSNKERNPKHRNKQKQKLWHWQANRGKKAFGLP